MGLIAAAGRGLRALTVRGRSVAQCASGHPITEQDLAAGRCPTEGCSTPDLLPDPELGEAIPGLDEEEL